MGKVKNWTVEKKDAIETMLIDLWASIGMGIPDNFDVIVQDCYEDVCECADPVNWHSGDVAIAFRRWIEAQTPRKTKTNVQDENVQDKPYFEIMKQGWDGELQREEIQIHGGEHANIFIVKTEEGFVIDVYGQNNSDPYTLAIWEENLMDEDEDEDLVFEFGK
jgi:hypothetical protein